MKHRDLFGTDPNFPGLPYTVSASVANIRDNMLAVRKSLDVLNIDEAKCLMQALSTLEDLFSELQARFAPKRTLEDLFNEAQRDHENSMAKAVASGLAGEEPADCPGPDLVDKDAITNERRTTMSASKLATPQSTFGRSPWDRLEGAKSSTTGCPAVDALDLAEAVLHGEITNKEIILKLLYINEQILGERKLAARQRSAKMGG